MSSKLRAIAEETAQIIEFGRYQAPDGVAVVLADDIAAAVAGTRLYLPGDVVAAPIPASGKPALEVTGETTLAAARRVGGDVVCLVFASARKPGGGFLNGAQAQEESLARASALYACLSAAPEFYAFHRQHADLCYSDRVIYSPAVPVFRDDDGLLLASPYRVSFLTAAAPNQAAITASQPEACANVPAALRTRTARVLEIAAANGHRGWCSAPGGVACLATTRPWSPNRLPSRSTERAGSSRSSLPSMTGSQARRSTGRSPPSFLSRAIQAAGRRGLGANSRRALLPAPRVRNAAGGYAQ